MKNVSVANKSVGLVSQFTNGICTEEEISVLKYFIMHRYTLKT